MSFSFTIYLMHSWCCRSILFARHPQHLKGKGGKGIRQAMFVQYLHTCINMMYCKPSQMMLRCFPQNWSCQMKCSLPFTIQNPIKDNQDKGMNVFKVVGNFKCNVFTALQISADFTVCAFCCTVCRQLIVQLLYFTGRLKNESQLHSERENDRKDRPGEGDQSFYLT